MKEGRFLIGDDTLEGGPNINKDLAHVEAITRVYRVVKSNSPTILRDGNGLDNKQAEYLYSIVLSQDDMNKRTT